MEKCKKKKIDGKTEGKRPFGRSGLR